MFALSLDRRAAGDNIGDKKKGSWRRTVVEAPVKVLVKTARPQLTVIIALLAEEK